MVHPGSSAGRPGSARPGTGRPNSGGIRPGSAQGIRDYISSTYEYSLSKVTEFAFLGLHSASSFFSQSEKGAQEGTQEEANAKAEITSKSKKRRLVNLRYLRYAISP